MRVFSLSALLGLLLTGLAADKTASEDAEFKSFADRFGKKYSSEKELAFRYAIYKKNLVILTPDPVKYDKKGRPLLGSAAPPLNYRSEVNDFADMTDEEFRSYYLLSKETLYRQTHGQMEAIAELNSRGRRFHNARLLQQVEETVRKLPRKVDWNAQGFVTPPKNQSRCNSCWAFSTVGVLEAFNKKNGGKELLFSEQELLDCDLENESCSGGQPAAALDYVRKSGISFAADYPYKGEKGEKCRVKVTNPPPKGKEGADKPKEKVLLGFSMGPSFSSSQSFGGSMFSSFGQSFPSSNYGFSNNQFSPYSFNQYSNSQYNSFGNDSMDSSYSPYSQQTYNSYNSYNPFASYNSPTYNKRVKTPEVVPPPVNAPIDAPPKPQTPIPKPTPTPTPTPTPASNPTPTPTPVNSPSATIDGQAKNRFYKLSGFKTIDQNLGALLSEIAKGPVIAAHYVSSQLKFYSSGVFTGDGCENVDTPNHSVLVVGYDLDASVPYILIKNSWGPLWGENGFYKLAIGDFSNVKGICLIAGTEFNHSPIFVS